MEKQNDARARALKRQKEKGAIINEMSEMLDAGKHMYMDQHYLEIFDDLFKKKIKTYYE